MNDILAKRVLWEKVYPIRNNRFVRTKGPLLHHPPVGLYNPALHKTLTWPECCGSCCEKPWSRPHMFNLLPRDTVFFDLFEGMARHVVRASEDLRQLAQNFPEITQHIQRIREEEHAADELAHQALDRLDRQFITPFDREDIRDLVGELDDIIDTIDALAKRFPLFHVKQMEAIFVKQAGVLVGAAVTLEEAVHRLRKSRK